MNNYHRTIKAANNAHSDLWLSCSHIWYRFRLPRRDLFRSSVLSRDECRVKEWVTDDMVTTINES